MSLNLQRVIEGTNAKPAGNGWLGTCPVSGAHKTPEGTLSIAKGDTQPVVVKCMAGCTQYSVHHALIRMGAGGDAPAADTTPPRLPRAPRETLADLTAKHGAQLRAIQPPAGANGTPPARLPAKTPEDTPPEAAGVPIPDTAPPAPDEHPTLGAPDHWYTYRDGEGEGRKLFFVCRWDANPPARPKKEHRPLRWTGKAWAWESWPAPRPLYGLNLLAKHPAAPVLVVEGEKACHAARKALGEDWVVVTWPGGVPNLPAADLSPLNGRKVTIWPDNDEPGRKAAKQIVERVPGAVVLDVSDMAEKADAADVAPEEVRRRVEDGRTVEIVPAAEVDTGEAWGDIKAGRFLADRIRGRMLWVCDLNKWHRWDGKRWIADGGGVHIEREAKDAALARCVAVLGDYANPETKAAVRGCDMPLIKRAINAAQSEDGLFTDANDLDRDAWLLNVRNGTVNLRTGELRPHDPSDRITKLCPVDFKPDAQAPIWERVVAETMCGDVELIRFLHLFLGYCLTGDCREQVFVVAHGAGQNGKGTLTRALGHVMGDYCTTMDTSTIMAKVHANAGGTREDLVALKGARLILASELNAGQRLDEAGVKALTGQDPITARPLYGRNVTFDMTGKIFLACNHLPDVKGQDQGIWRRIRKVPFSYVVPPDKRDNDLDAKLRREAEGILAWLVRGCLDWHRAGRLPEARAVTEASEEYRNASDTLGGFLTECVVREPGAKAQSAPLYKAYEAFSRAHGEVPVPQKRFAEMLMERGFTRTRPQNVAHWHGLQLKGPVRGGEGCSKTPHTRTHEEVSTTPNHPSPVTADPAARDTQ